MSRRIRHLEAMHHGGGLAPIFYLSKFDVPNTKTL